MPKGKPGRPIIVCPGCSQDKAHHAKGLCEVCYRHHRYEKNREEVLARCHRYYEENQEEVLARCRRYYEENRERKLAYHRHYREEHRERITTYMRHWRQENPEKAAAIDARRFARKQALPDTLTPEQAEHLFVIGQTTYPGRKLHLDHIVPISKRGGTTRANCHYVPAKLNLSKGDKLPEEIYAQLSF